MKSLFFLSLVALVGAPPVLAETVTPPVLDYTQLGVQGALIGVIVYLLKGVLPQYSKDAKDAVVEAAREHKEAQVKVAELNKESAGSIVEAVGTLTEETRAVRNEIRAGNDSQLGLLRTVVLNQKDHKPPHDMT
jgi:hypothetical protein